MDNIETNVNTSDYVQTITGLEQLQGYSYCIPSMKRELTTANEVFTALDQGIITLEEARILLNIDKSLVAAKE